MAVFVRITQNTRKHLNDSGLKQKSAHKNNIQCPDSLRLGPIDSDPGRLSETGLRVNSGFLVPSQPSWMPIIFMIRCALSSGAHGLGWPRCAILRLRIMVGFGFKVWVWRWF